MKNISLTLPALCLSMLFLSGCSNKPNSLQLTPQLDTNITTVEVKSEHSWLLNSQDLRSQRYLIAITSGDKVATLINESTSTRQLVENTLKAHWAKQGHRFTKNSDNGSQIEIQLLKLVAEVEEATFSHEIDLNAVIKVQIKSDKTIFSKTFRSHYEEKAPLSASVEKLTEKLNTQLSRLLDQIVQDPEINDKLLQL